MVLSVWKFWCAAKPDGNEIETVFSIINQSIKNLNSYMFKITLRCWTISITEIFHTK